MLADLDGLGHAEALACLRVARADGDHSPVTMLNLAIAEDRNGNGEQARTLMRELAALLPDWDEPRLRLAESLRREGDGTGAEQAYAAVLEINPRREEALVGSAALMLQRGDGTTAQQLLWRCLSINPERAEAWDALGLALMPSGDWQAATDAFGEAQRLAPVVLSYALHLVEAAHAAGTLEVELARLELSSEADPLNPALLAARGFALERLGRRSEAIDTLETACALAPDAAGPAMMAGRLFARANRLREAEAMLHRAAELAPGDHALRNDHAAVLMRLQRHAAARVKLETILQDWRPDPSVLCNLAAVLVSLGRQEEGEEAARQAIALDPMMPLARRALANALVYRAGVGGAELLRLRGTTAARRYGGVRQRTRSGPEAADRPAVRLIAGASRGMADRRRIRGAGSG
jgi:Flp pilus assembly protein TadD